MALVDLVKITAASTGTGAITFGPAVAGYRGAEALTNGATYGYSIQQESDYEIGRGTYLSVGQQFVRSPFFSSNGGTTIDLQPNASVALVATAEDFSDLIDQVAAARADTLAYRDTAQNAAIQALGSSVGAGEYEQEAERQADIARSAAEAMGIGLLPWVETYGNAQAASQRSRLATRLATANSSQPITIAWEGDSLAYGFQTGGPNPPINGATGFPRSARNAPDELASALTAGGYSVTVTNRGYPGDRTTEGLTRWASAPATDVTIICYQANDANNYNSNPGSVSVAQSADNLEQLIIRRLQQNSAVIVLGTSNVSDLPANNRILPYKLAHAAIAAKYGCEFVDLADILQSVTQVWTDGVHLTSFAYAEEGQQLAGHFLSRYAGLLHVADGDVFYPTDGLFRGGAILADARATSGNFLGFAPGQTVYVAAHFDSNVSPRFYSYTDAYDVQFTLKYAGGSNATRGLSDVLFIHDRAAGFLQSVVGHELRRGYRVLAITNTGTQSAYCPAIVFESRSTMATRGELCKVADLTGSFLTRRQAAAFGSFWTEVAPQTRLRAPYTAVFRIKTAGTSLAGPALWTDLGINGDFVSPAGLLVYRNGLDLLLQEFQAGAATTIGTATGVFSAGSSDDEYHIDVTAAGSVKIYVNGASSATITATSTLVNIARPGLAGGKTEALLCYGAYVSQLMKGPY